MTTSNPNCAGTSCRFTSSTIRLVPLCSCSLTPMCEDCYNAEMLYNSELEEQGLPRPLPRKPFYMFSVEAKLEEVV